MAEKEYICRKCGVTFSAIPGQEEPPECPECEKSEIEKHEDASIVTDTESKPC
ncbi:MAG: hypothetical protein ACYDHW_11990 [Syntrophorhabdaceae bacterium]